MASEEFELYIHSQGARPKIAVARPHEVLGDVLVREGIIKQGQDDVLIFAAFCGGMSMALSLYRWPF